MFYFVLFVLDWFTGLYSTHAEVLEQQLLDPIVGTQVDYVGPQDEPKETRPHAVKRHAPRGSHMWEKEQRSV